MSEVEMVLLLFLVGVTSVFSYNAGSITGGKDMLRSLEIRGIIRIEDKKDSIIVSQNKNKDD